MRIWGCGQAGLVVFGWAGKLASMVFMFILSLLVSDVAFVILLFGNV